MMDMSEEKEVEKIMLDAVFTVSDARNLSFPHLRENIDKMQDLFKSLESRLKEAERQNTTLHDMLDKLEAKHLFTEQRLSQAEKELADFKKFHDEEFFGWEKLTRDLKVKLSQAEAEVERFESCYRLTAGDLAECQARLSHLMDVAKDAMRGIDGLVEDARNANPSSLTEKEWNETTL